MEQASKRASSHEGGLLLDPLQENSFFLCAHKGS
jgi:hypothetical protein